MSETKTPVFKQRENTIKDYTMKVRITFIKEALGSKPADKDVHGTFIASKRPPDIDPKIASEEDERAAAAAEADKREETGTSIYHRDKVTGRPGFDAYVLKGFFKEACKTLRAVPENPVKELKNYVGVIDKMIHISPDFIPVSTDKVGMCQRSLRMTTAQGPRVTLKQSESLEPGTYFDATIECLNETHLDYVRRFLDYGKKSGLGEWRNAAYGRFTWQEFAE